METHEVHDSIVQVHQQKCQEIHNSTPQDIPNDQPLPKD